MKKTQQKEKKLFNENHHKYCNDHRFHSKIVDCYFEVFVMIVN